MSGDESGEHVHAAAHEVTEDVRRRRRLDTLTRISAIVTDDDLDARGATTRAACVLAEAIDAECTIAMLSEDDVTLASSEAEAVQTRAAVLAHPSRLVVPLLAGKRVLGILKAERRGARPLSAEDRLLATEVAASMGLYLAHVPRRDEIVSLRDRLIALGDALPGLVAFVDRSERYQYVNAAYEQWFRLPRSAFVGKTILEVAPMARAYPSLQPHVRRALAGEAVRFRTHIAYPDAERDVDAHYIPVTRSDGTVDGFAVLVQDITAEVRVAEMDREARDAERRATQRLESVLTLTAKLAAAARPDEIARVLVDEGIEVLSAERCALHMLSPDGQELTLLRERGFLPEIATAVERVPLANGGPLTECVETGRPVLVDSRKDYATRYTEFERTHRSQPHSPLSLGVFPLLIEGKAVGCFGYLRSEERPLTSVERTYVEVLASHGAEALRRARLYAELRDVSETREAMIQASPAAIALLDEHEIVRAWNPAAEGIFGWSAEEILGRPPPFRGHDGAEIEDFVGQVLSGTVIHGREARWVRRSGEWFDLELYAAPVTLSDGRSMCLSMIVDIAERRRVERGRQIIADASALLARSLEPQATLDEVVRLPIPHMADFGFIDLIHDGTLHRIALSQEELEGGVRMPRVLREGARLGPVSPALRAGKPIVLRDVDETTMRALARDEAHMRAIRALRVRSALVAPLVAGDRVIGALTLTSRTRNFDELDIAVATELAARIAAGLEHARLYEEAQSARRDAEAASRAKDEFLAMLGHELRNPLAPMATALQLMRMRAPDMLERERAVIERQVAYVSRLVDDLLDVSRITRGKVELQREHTPVAAAVAKAVELTSQLLEQRRHRLSVDVPNELSVFADATRLSQIVANLLSNSAKYTPAGGSIVVTATERGNEVALEVRDDGAGIAPEMLPRIFEIFVQAPQNSARPEGGLGLGLTIVKNLVALHGGRVSAQSDGLGKGTTVTVTLPAAPPPSDVAMPSPDGSTRRLVVTRRVLVVDDNEDAALLLGEALEAHGHETRTAFDGPSALRIAEEFRPDVAVLDIGLPVMDGYELAERLRSGSGNLRLIAVTGYGQSSDRARAVAAGFHAHLAKPVSLEALVRLVEQSD